MAAVDDPAWALNWSQIWDRIAAATPDALAVVAGDTTRSYRELEDRAARLAGAFAERGVGHGDPVGLFLYNRPEYLEAIYALFKLGAIPVNMNFRYRARELAELVRTSESRLLLYPETLGEVVHAASADFGAAIGLVEIADGDETRFAPVVPGAEGFDELVLADRIDGVPGLGGHDRIYMFTGGTTGAPKAVVWRHGDLLDAQLVSIYGTAGVPFPRDLDQVVDLAVRPDVPTPRTLPIAPLMHAAAMFGSMNTLTAGGVVVFLDSPSFDPAQALREVGRNRVTRLIIAGNAVATPLVEELDRAARSGDPHDVSTLDTIVSSGMAWTDDRKAGLLRHVETTLIDIVGASEGGPFAYAIARSPGDLPSRLRLADGAVVLDGEGHPVREGVGVLAYRGAMPIGYLDQPEKTAEVYRDVDGIRHVVPGDWVRVDPDGVIEFLGRDSTVINTGGEKVYPVEVEDVLLQHPDVVDAAVFGVPDDRWGSVVAGVVARRAGSRPTAAELTEYLGERLAGYKRPRRLLIRDSLGRGPSGKVDLRLLQRLVAESPSEE
jgi:acyl-CoA synthetase (AMP-forming)/AMP-acid ligase II